MTLVVITSVHRDLTAAGTATATISPLLGGAVWTAIMHGALIMKAKSLLIALAFASVALVVGWMALRGGGEPEPDRSRDLLHRHRPEVESSRVGLEYFPQGVVQLDGSDTTFRFDITEPGAHIITAQAGAAWGWLGPLDLGGSGSPDTVTVPVGGPGCLELEVRTAGGSPLESVLVTLRPRPHRAFNPGARTDASGRAVIESFPAGRYQLHVSGGDLGDVVEMVDIAGRLERSVALAPASWMLVDLDPPGVAGEHAILALVTSGGDPGWPHRSRREDLPVAGAQFSGKPVRIKIRPGAYRIRFEVKESHATSPDLSVRELDIVVPQGGEAAVRLDLER